ncbi:MAG: hypothetical protein A4E53_01651 [Pelotomaculum sp. PtaB.Bin104]|jgi:hypothetical protein|nr:MAG: hypothetical protein A4E53_01651 [Pelotomaculum sp. PtaB.Bin104]
MNGPHLKKVLKPTMQHKKEAYRQDELINDPDGMIGIASYIIGALVAIACVALMLRISVH